MFFPPQGGDLKGYAQVTPKLEYLLRGPSPLGKAAMKLQRYRVGPTTYRIDRLPYCTDPVPIGRHEKGVGSQLGFSLEMFAPCRKCEKCLLFRKKKWQERIDVELQKAPRSWFVTLTFSPVHLAGVLIESYKNKGDATSALERAAYSHVQRYFKRLRKSGLLFRYVCVFEYGEALGRLHAHLFIHETLEGQVTKSVIENQWRSHVHARLVRNNKVASYVTKYMTKSLTKPRASFSYGKTGTYIKK